MSRWYDEEEFEISEISRPSWDYLSERVAPDYLRFVSERAVRRQRIYMLVAQEDFHLAGYALFTPKTGYADTICLSHILTVLENRNKRVAARLIEYAGNILKGAGAKKIETFCLEEDKEDAVPLFESLGFKRNGTKIESEYTIEQLIASTGNIREAEGGSGKIMRIEEIDKSMADRLFGDDISAMKGMDPKLSAILLQGGKYRGFCAIRRHDGKLCLDNLHVTGNKDAASAYLMLWKYSIDKLIEVGKENDIDEVTLRVDIRDEAMSEALEKILGTPADKTVIPLYTKEL